ncbi:S-adenosyl-L-methionine-dependent methyltransferase [Terfezia boudieri ATCC MYA-4762]|uniref:S-adenosyl-L-methionine-dependent methyltransferase n=1 Tax=Terfezia boudieri ATCC MYA-4762 TaxID=1051890 RepID=A0A3N4L9N7_9PEZI|nr:S-adenosyl-L-methionine-dependent methyltransferase [Terfezia boudieri ATCC MYA-4762]
MSKASDDSSITGAAKVVPTQYDSIGQTYTPVTYLPTVRLTTSNIRDIVTPLLTSCSSKPVRALDIACGTGFYTRSLLEWGADLVVGSDISTSMVDTARTQSTHLQNSITYFVADASLPAFPPKETMAGQTLPKGELFDVVTGIWCLNYASSSAHLKRFFTTISQNLKPGGSFIGVVPNIHTTDLKPLNEVWIEELTVERGLIYGYSISKVIPITEGEGAGEGYSVHITAHVQPKPVEFDCYFLNGECFEKAALESGLGKIEWLEVKDAAEFNGEFGDFSDGFWDTYKGSRSFNIIRIRKQ